MSQSAGPGLHQAEGALSHAAQRVAETHDDLLRLGSQLTGQIEGLRSAWVGVGADAFHRLHQAWQDKQRRIVGALTGLEAALQETQTAVVAADQNQSDLMTRTAARLG